MKTTFRNKDYSIKIWDGCYAFGQDVAIDTETTIVPFTETPDLVTFQAFDGTDVYYIPLNLQDKFWEQNSNIIMHNASFDIDVLCKEYNDSNFFHSRVESEKIWDTMILYQLVHLATIGYVPHKSSLAHVTQVLFNEELEKEDAVRMEFGQFKGTDVADIPSEFLEYGALDVIATYYCYRELKLRAQRTGSTTALSHQIQLAGSIALNRIYKNGIGFNVEGAEQLLHEIQSKMEIHSDILATYGWARGVKGSKDQYEKIISEFFQLDLPRTEDGSISSKSEDLLPYKDNHFVKSYLEFHDLEKQTTFIRDLKEDVVHPRYKLLMNTGRTSCSKPNFQQLPRAGSIRNLFRAQDGNTFIITDYSTLELCTLAQITYSKYGESRMRDLINDDLDLHRYYASVLHGIPESRVTKQQRQEAKAANFGFPGGLGIDTFRKFSEGYGLSISREEADQMRKAWFQAFPEMSWYMNEEEVDEAAWTLTGRKRANASYCARKNTPFQGLAADGCKIALYYLEMNPRFTLRGFVHDEIISECGSWEAGELMPAMEKTMIDSMQVVCPDVKISVESQISDVYCK